MPFCTPLWRLLFRGDQDAATARKGASREKLDKGTTTAESKTKQGVDSKPRVLTKEEKLKEQKRKDIEKLRETLRLRRELLDGIVEVPLKKGTIEGYQIRVVRRSSQGVMGSPCKGPAMMSARPQHTKESVEKFSKFIESKIKQMEEETKAKGKGKSCGKEKLETMPKDPVQEALIKRLLELQAERDVKKKAQPERTDKKAKPTDENRRGKDRSRKCSKDTPKGQKDARRDESHKTKEVPKGGKSGDQPSSKHKPDKDKLPETLPPSENQHKSDDDKEHGEESEQKKDDDHENGKTIDTPQKSSKETAKAEKPSRDTSPKTKERSKGGKSKDQPSKKQKRETTDAAEPHDDKPKKLSKVEEGENHGEHHGENPDIPKHSKSEHDTKHSKSEHDTKHSKSEHDGGKREGADTKTEETEGNEHAKDDVGDGGEPVAGEHKKSLKSKKSKGKK